MTGWASLHDAAVQSGEPLTGFMLDVDEWDEVFVDPEIHTSLTGRVLQLTKVDPEQYGRSEVAINDAVAKALKHQAPKKHYESWDLLTQATSVAEVLDDFAQANWPIALEDWKAWPESTPQSLASTAMGLLRSYSKDEGENWKFMLWGLGLIGILRRLIKTGHCDLCFRKARLGQRLCRWHSQAHTTGKEKAEAYIRFRAGKKAYALANDRGILDEVKGSSMFRSLTKALVLPSLLYRFTYEVETDAMDFEYIRHALQVSPRVRELLGAVNLSEHSHESLIQLLREKLDIDDYEDRFWENKILLAERWLTLEAEVMPGRNGRRPKTNTRKAKARKLRNEGHSYRGIAAELDISAAAIAKWPMPW